MDLKIIGYIVLIGIGVFYLIYTIKYSLIFQKNLIYHGKLKIFHMIMFWIVPFIWISIIKALSESTKGSYQYDQKQKRESESWSDPYSPGN